MGQAWVIAKRYEGPKEGGKGAEEEGRGKKIMEQVKGNNSHGGVPWGSGTTVG